jgi:hypothetical protein
MIKFKVKSSKGHQVLALEDNTTFDSLLKALGMKNATIKTGYPYQKINYEITDAIKEYIRNGDSVLAEEIDQSDKEALPAMQSFPVARKSASEVAVKDGILVVREIMDDNNCLFRAIARTFLNEDLGTVRRLRELVANIIRSDPTYDAAILGRPVEEYCKWIQRDGSWGGGIELAIFSARFETST